MNPKNTHVDTTKTTTHIGLCAGYGGIELGLKRVIPDLRTVALCEIEAFACANLVSKMEAGLMDAAPIWSDLKTFPWTEFRGKVDILTGGYPCQPFSAAGKRAGKDDPRHLWPSIADGIRLLQPRCCLFENVEGHITLGLSTVISDLEELGYKVSWGIFSASEVGAPHQRKRVFILAISNTISQGSRKVEDWWKFASQSGFDGDGGKRGTQWPSRPGEPQHGWEPPRVVADSDRKQSQRGRNAGELESTSGAQQSEIQQRQRSRHAFGDQGSAGPVVGNAELQGLERRTIIGDGHAKESSKGRPREVEPTLGRDADGPADRVDDAELYTTCDNRTDELRLLGNGVVPATAERAFRVLMARL